MRPMDLRTVRQRSIDKLAGSGLAIPDHLPLLDELSLRSEDEVINRLGCLHVCAASAYGFSRDRSLAWARAEGLLSSFEKEEAVFLRGEAYEVRFRFQVEAIFALCWAVGFERRLNWFEAVDDGFALRLPNLKTGERLARFRARATLRDVSEIAEAADYGYCLHWTMRDAALRGGDQAIPIEQYVIVERRRALEWLIGDAKWYEVSLDT